MFRSSAKKGSTSHRGRRRGGRGKRGGGGGLEGGDSIWESSRPPSYVPGPPQGTGDNLTRAREEVVEMEFRASFI